MLKKMFGALGIGGPSVDTVLADPRVMPGGTLTGEVRITGGNDVVEIEHVALGLTAVVRTDDASRQVEFDRTIVTGRFTLGPNEPRTIPFRLQVPWETPLTDLHGQHLRGMDLGLRTELSVAKALDKGDLDRIAVQPLPSQQAVLEGFARLGFRFMKADLEPGRIHGTAQRLPFFQEIEFYPSPQFAGRINEVELTFVTEPHGMMVVLEADKRGGLFTAGQDAFGRFQVTHQQAESTDWAAEISRWLDQVASRRASFMSGHGGGHGGHGRGIGGAAAGIAGGVAAGMILGEVFDEIGDAFFGDE